ncbi:hypothetical protein FB451DRAFT_272662 [Mycena latifolia]|nr:hypothetical protein FB451DRAFT_272662 [Mycena latifolia]
MKSPEALTVFSQMQLPSLRRATIGLKGDWDITLLKTHGAKLDELQVENATISKQTVLALCPNITALTCRIEERDDYDFGCSTLDAGFKHALLSKLILNKYTTKGKAEKKQREAFFQAMDVSHLRALRTVCIPSLQWPTTEHEIAKSVWVEWAAILLARGLKLTDSVGTEWRPRLKCRAEGTMHVRVCRSAVQIAEIFLRRNPTARCWRSGQRRRALSAPGAGAHGPRRIR